MNSGSSGMDYDYTSISAPLTPKATPLNGPKGSPMLTHTLAPTHFPPPRPLCNLAIRLPYDSSPSPKGRIKSSLLSSFKTPVFPPGLIVLSLLCLQPSTPAP